MKHILLIDDEENMLALTGRWLEKEGYSVSKATSGEMALDILKEERPALILLDYFMPGMDGPAVLKAIRSDDTLKDIPVLFRTGADDEDISEGEFKADGIIPKSQGKPFLLAAVKKTLGQ